MKRLKKRMGGPGGLALFCLAVLAGVPAGSFALLSAADEPLLPGSHETRWTEHLAARIGGEAEVVLMDGSRVDILRMGWAVEVDRAARWAEAIGQSLYYAELTGREPAVILLVADPAGEKLLLLRAHIACRRAGVTLWLFDTRPARRGWLSRSWRYAPEGPPAAGPRGAP